VCKISVIITTFNRPKLLRKAIISVINQTFQDFEIIVVDDSQSDDAKRVCDGFNDYRIRCYKNTKAKGACGARNTGIEKAKGVYYTGLDDDDEFYDTRLNDLLDIYDKKYAFVASNMVLLKGDKLSKVFFFKSRISYKDILWNNCVGTQVFTELYKVRSVCGFDESFESSQDVDLWARLIKKWGDGYRAQKVLYKMNISHGGTRISTSENKLKGAYKFHERYKDEMTSAQRILSEFRLKWLKKNISNKDCLNVFINPEIWVFFLRKILKVC